MRAVLFDLDSTVVELGVLYQDVTTRLGGSSSPQGGFNGVPPTAWGPLLAEYSGMPSDGLSQRVLDLIEEGLPDFCRPTPRIRRCFEQLMARNCMIGIVTNNCERIAVQILSYAGLRPMCSTIVCAEDGHLKPSAEPWALAASRLGFSPRECLAVDDRPNNLEAPARLGMATCCMSFEQLQFSTLLPWLEVIL